MTRNYDDLQPQRNYEGDSATKLFVYTNTAKFNKSSEEEKLKFERKTIDEFVEKYIRIESLVKKVEELKKYESKLKKEVQEFTEFYKTNEVILKKYNF